MPTKNDCVVEVPPQLARQFNSVRVRNAVIIDTFLKLHECTGHQVEKVRGQVRAMMEELAGIDKVLYQLDCELLEKEAKGERWRRPEVEPV